MDKRLIDKGLVFYNQFKDNKIDEVDSLEFKTWLAEAIRNLESVAGKSKLMEVTDLIKVFLQNKESITINQLELIVAFLKAEYEISQEQLRSIEAMYKLND
ncbi:hypothetical protein [Rummeliibacillus sp. POC4]|uniref:hypothetical protein n=1 Tax=Rummeliibacillus sp. POC4 TaxID=2305899 RepID=UPI000E6646EB|nr:hypothetical protein [Rummeliibacillus sp. POC4]RIJ63796.1 hypothetical protein D1606_13350 [Rummeliibacillus sp. POC4]